MCKNVWNRFFDKIGQMNLKIEYFRKKPLIVKTLKIDKIPIVG